MSKRRNVTFGPTQLLGTLGTFEFKIKTILEEKYSYNCVRRKKQQTLIKDV